MEKFEAEKIKRLIDERQEIENVLMRYCRSVDRMDWDTVRSCYHPDATDNHGLYSGPVDGFIDFFRNWAGEQYKCAMHLIGNVLIEFNDNIAVSEAYSVTYLRMNRDKALGPEFKRLWAGDQPDTVLEEQVDAVDLTLGLRMIDRFEQRGADMPWLIAHREIVHEWNKLEPVRYQLNVDQVLQNGKRNQSDLIFTSLAELISTSSQSK